MTGSHLKTGDSSASSIPGERSAYTLLELLIAAVLVAALMSVVWGMISMYNSYLTAGQVQATEQQLVRSLFQLMTDDLQSVSLPPGPHALPRSAEVIPGQTELTGTRHALRMTVRRSPLPQRADSGVPANSGTAPTASADSEPVSEPVSEPESYPVTGVNVGESQVANDGFQTIAYQSQSSLTGSMADPAMPAGLYRLQTDSLRLQVLLSQQEDASAERMNESVPLAPADPHLSRDILETLVLSPAPDQPPVSAGTRLSDRPRLEAIPEVVSCRFAYFDGGRWHAAWDSRLRRGLPEAVRIRLRLASPSTSGVSAAPSPNNRIRSYERIVLLGSPAPRASSRDGEFPETAFPEQEAGAAAFADSGPAKEAL